jgi:hypothetical protein
MQTIQGANLQAADAARPGRRPGLALAVLAASQLMIVLDMSVVNIALPHIQRALNFSTTSLSWVVNAYTLAFGGMQVSVGSGYVDKILSPMLLFGLGMGLLVVPLIILAVSNLEPYEAGAASSLLSVMQQVGGSLGLAILMTVFGAVSRSQATEETVSVRHLGRLHRRGRIRAGRAGVSAAAIRAHGTGDIHLSTIPGVSALTRSWSVPTSPEGPGTRSPQRTKGAQIMTGKPSFADWVADHAITADSLDPRAPLDDLEPLGELIGDARVVGIGESAHYVREFYLLRHRLLRFLVERCDFSVYAPEAPFTQARAIDA